MLPLDPSFLIPLIFVQLHTDPIADVIAFYWAHQSVSKKPQKQKFVPTIPEMVSNTILKINRNIIFNLV